MTDPLQSYDVELLKRYDAELQEIESLPPAAIELPASQALALVTIIQIGRANPSVEHSPVLPSAIAAAAANSIELQSRKCHLRSAGTWLAGGAGGE
jgi:hypothetical protein